MTADGFHPAGLYEYLLTARQRLLDFFRPLPPDQYTREFPFGHKTIRATLVHVAAAEWLYNRRLLGEPVPPLEDRPFTRFYEAEYAPFEAAWRAQSEETKRPLREIADWSRSGAYAEPPPPPGAGAPPPPREAARGAAGAPPAPPRPLREPLGGPVRGYRSHVLRGRGHVRPGDRQELPFRRQLPGAAARLPEAGRLDDGAGHGAAATRRRPGAAGGVEPQPPGDLARAGPNAAAGGEVSSDVRGDLAGPTGPRHAGQPRARAGGAGRGLAGGPRALRADPRRGGSAGRGAARGVLRPAQPAAAGAGG